MDWTLEVVMVPVIDVDRARSFYADMLGFALDHDTRAGDAVRIVQLTPPGSGCSIVIGTGLTTMAPGSLEGLQLVVPDILAAREELVARGADVGEVQVYGSEGLRPYEPGEPLDNVGFLHFEDPDGNKWAIQQISARAART